MSPAQHGVLQLWLCQQSPSISAAHWLLYPLYLSICCRLAGSFSGKRLRGLRSTAGVLRVQGGQFVAAVQLAAFSGIFLKLWGVSPPQVSVCPAGHQPPGAKA